MIPRSLILLSFARGTRKKRSLDRGGRGSRMRALDGDLNRAAEILKSVAHPLRLRILSLLCDREQYVSAMATRLGTKPTAVSQALAILRGEGLVTVTRSHGRASYRLEERALQELIPWVEGLGTRASGRRAVPP